MKHAWSVSLFGILSMMAVVSGVGDARAQPARVCGASIGRSCPPSDFCELPTGTCRLVSARGTCVTVPHICPDLYAPVCGCNGRTYANDCERRTARVDKMHDGMCRR